MANALLIGPAEKAALAALRARAEAAPFDVRMQAKRLQTEAGRAAHVRKMTEQSILLPVAYAVTFTIETGHPGGTARHMAMSVERAGRVPTKEAMWMVAEPLGFQGSLEACDAVWVEALEGRVGKAINIVQFFATADAALVRH